MEEFKREIAHKVWIGDLIKGEFVRGAGQFDPNYLKINNKNISRVNLIVSVIDKLSGENYENFIVDDGSGTISLKTWNEDVNLFLDIQIGDIVLVVGKIKEYNNKFYLSPEIIKKVDNPLWLKVRKLELVNLHGEIERVEETKDNNVISNVIEEKVEDDIRDKVLELISRFDLGDGANIEDIVENCGEESKELIEELIKGGEVFEIRKGKLKIM